MGGVGERSNAGQAKPGQPGLFTFCKYSRRQNLKQTNISNSYTYVYNSLSTNTSNWRQAKILFTCCQHFMHAGYNQCRHPLTFGGKYTFCTSFVIVNLFVYLFVYLVVHLCLCICARQDISFAPLTLLQLDDDISVRPLQQSPQQKAWKETKPAWKYFLENPFDKWTKYLSARECKCCPFFCAALG